MAALTCSNVGRGEAGWGGGADGDSGDVGIEGAGTTGVGVEGAGGGVGGAGVGPDLAGGLFTGLGTGGVMMAGGYTRGTVMVVVSCLGSCPCVKEKGSNNNAKVVATHTRTRFILYHQ
jgi:hypothetical protein